MENTFISYEKALSIIEEHKGNFTIESRNIEDCIGLYLAEDLIADRDFPPFDRVTMDGIAIVFDSFHNAHLLLNRLPLPEILKKHLQILQTVSK